MSSLVDYDEAGFISVFYEGDATMEDMNDLITRGALLAKERNCFHVLGDFRAMKPDLSVLELYDLPNQLVSQTHAKEVPIYEFKRALVVPSVQFEKYKFFEIVAVNRSQRVKVFTDMNDAKNWLLAK